MTEKTYLGIREKQTHPSSTHRKPIPLPSEKRWPPPNKRNRSQTLPHLLTWRRSGKSNQRAEEHAKTNLIRMICASLPYESAAPLVQHVAKVYLHNDSRSVSRKRVLISWRSCCKNRGPKASSHGRSAIVLATETHQSKAQFIRWLCGFSPAILPYKPTLHCLFAASQPFNSDNAILTTAM